MFNGISLHSDKYSPWALSAQDAVKYYTSTYILMQNTTIWVNPDDLLLAGQKHETQILLTECAQSLGLEHPIAVHVEEQHLSDCGDGHDQ